MAVLGSVHMFSDQYLDKEENAKVQVQLWGLFLNYYHAMLTYNNKHILPFILGWLLVLMLKLACVSDTNCSRAVTMGTSIPNKSNNGRIILG